MLRMFRTGYSFNRDISAWDISSVTDMAAMFEHTNSFNADISAWDTSSVTNMLRMFRQAYSFNRDISAWDISSVTDIRSMFSLAFDFNQNLCAWKDKFPYDDAYGIFFGSGCTFKSTPIKKDQGPFCAGSASQCQAYTQQPSSKPSSSETSYHPSVSAMPSPSMQQGSNGGNQKDKSIGKASKSKGSETKRRSARKRMRSHG
ncbi:hypothetical protein ACHAWT_001825 [Skeletonema menzelii]